MELCNEKLNPEMFKTADDIQAFTDTLIHVAEKCIPKSSTRLKRNRPWFNKDVKNSINNRKSSSANYSETFQNIKQEREKEHLNFMSLKTCFDKLFM